jgi:hypothetical protein
MLHSFNEHQPTSLRKGFGSPTFNSKLDHVYDALEGYSFGASRKNGKAKVNGVGGVGIVR